MFSFFSKTGEFFNRITTLIHIFKYLSYHKQIILLLVGGIFESGISLLALGQTLGSLSQLFTYFILAALVAIISDILILNTFRFIFHKYRQKAVDKSQDSNFISFFKRHSRLSITFYRFVPFGRIPFLATASVTATTKDFMIFSTLGAILWSFVWMYIGYNALSKLYIIKLWNIIIRFYTAIKLRIIS